MKRLMSYLGRRGEVPRYEAAYEALDQLFKERRDPWYFGTDNYESSRFDKILEIVDRVPHDSLLEVGCAEGHLTRRLCEICQEVTAFDVSPTAVERARQTVPHAKILQGRLEDIELGRKFDLVCCSETIYYVSDVPAAIHRLNSLGNFILVTYTLYERHALDPIFSRIPTIYNAPFHYFRLLDGDRLINWRGIQIVLWWSGAYRA